MPFELLVSSVLVTDPQQTLLEVTDRVMSACVGVFVCVYFLCVDDSMLQK